ITGGRGVDVAFEALGRPQTILHAFGAVRDGGRVVVVGIAAGDTAVPIPITRLVRRGVRVIGSYGGRVRTDVPAILRLVAQGGSAGGGGRWVAPTRGGGPHGGPGDRSGRRPCDPGAG